MSTDYDVVVIGAGMAGASIAAHLAQTAKVCVVEMEDQPGFHSTGRSAAIFSQSYGNAVIRALSRASRDFLYAPPAGFSAAALVKPRAVLAIARHDESDALEAFGGRLEPGEGRFISAREAQAICPVLRTEDLAGGFLDDTPADIEVHELHQGYLRLLKARGGVLATGGGVIAVDRLADGWKVTTGQGALRAGIVVNAAGAWAGAVAAMAGAQDIGMTPLKRTACLIEAPAGAEAWPMVKDVGETFYVKPDAGLLLLSPCDETLSAPTDVQADEMDIAIAVDRLERATTLQVRRVTHRWAGLRSFVADRSPVVGFDAIQPDFFWHAAMGGYGIQIAPAVSRLAAALVLERQIEASLGVDPEALSPRRLAAPVSA